MRTVIIVQARMTSTRLPGKVLKEVLDKPLLQYQIERLKRVKSAEELVIATTTNSTDQPIVNLCNKLGVSIFRGSEEDVLGRYYHAATTYGAEAVVRLTSDCPLLDPQLVDNVIQLYKKSYPDYHYASNVLTRSFPRGMDTEVFSYTALAEAFIEANVKPEREHVTSFIYNRPGRYKTINYLYKEDQSRHRWTVDTPEDFELVSRIIKSIYPAKECFTLEDCIELLNKNPEWENINAAIEQKQYGN
ncbi:glycosyltransferase family protein [Dendrosporobacter sp. 1207_IL3150]|uniref:glycosyltransferase family protein n=1 Tax=Dendrosporobacter sp. 1207_IL3150 TaxID=3084054 RepID=UPI002FD98A36